ncbi:hypothetical protein AB0I81_52865 [Nonomuraea sp. NPDC050404]|uniref:hypothetical protein n=1 Tax=Nonomuraea sp. NPDC050404 TaxID=3155783 RepID=UPI0033F48784
MSHRYTQVLAGLRTADLLPASHECVFVSGSVVRGWGNPTSDLDLHVISAEPWTGGESSHVALDPGTLRHEGAFVDGVRWDVEYWLGGQIEQLLEKVSWKSFEADHAVWKSLSPAEIGMLERLPYAVAVAGADRLHEVRERLRSSAHRSVFVSYALDMADSYTEDAAGQCATGDLHSAVLTARLAFEHAVDALLAGHGQFGSKWPKWRARRWQEANPAVMTFEEFWSLATMRTFDPADPRAWVEQVIAACQKIFMEVDV